MSEDEEPRRVAAVCESCGISYAAVEQQNGEVRAIGSPGGCCDGADLTVVNDESSESETFESW